MEEERWKRLGIERRLLLGDDGDWWDIYGGFWMHCLLYLHLKSVDNTSMV